MSAVEIIKIFFAEYDGFVDIIRHLTDRSSVYLALDESEDSIFLNFICEDSVFEDGVWDGTVIFVSVQYKGISVGIEEAKQRVLITPELIEELTAIREMASL